MTYLHTDLQMLTKKPWSFHSKKLDENEKSLETYENHPGEVRCGIVSMNQGFVDSKWKMYSLTYFYPYLVVCRMSRLI